MSEKMTIINKHHQFQLSQTLKTEPAHKQIDPVLIEWWPMLRPTEVKAAIDVIMAALNTTCAAIISANIVSPLFFKS